MLQQEALDAADEPALQAVLVGEAFGLKSPVRAGENKGRELQHDFVVLGHNTFDSHIRAWSGKLPKAPMAEQAEKLALVAWVSRPDHLGPIQAVGGWR